jgi:hypothetical protein
VRGREPRRYLNRQLKSFGRSDPARGEPLAQGYCNVFGCDVVD